MAQQSPFQRYQGGGFEIPNIAQAGANIGATYQQGLSSLGKSIGEGIQAYNAGISQNQAADAKLAAAIRNTGMLAGALEMHPDYKDIAGSLAAKIEEYRGVEGKGLSQKLVAINDLETSSQTVQQAIQYQDMAAQALALQAYNETPETKIKNAHGVLAEHGYTPGVTGSLEKAIQRLISQVEKNNKEQGVKPGDVGYTDVQQSLNELLGRARLGIKQAVTSDPKNLTLINAEAELEGAVKRYAGYNKLENASGLSDVGSAIIDIYGGFMQQYEANKAMEPEVDPMSLPYGAGRTNPAAYSKIDQDVTDESVAAFQTPAERARSKKLRNLTDEELAALRERDSQVETVSAQREGENLRTYKRNRNVAEGFKYFIEKLEKGDEGFTTWDYNKARGRVVGFDGGSAQKTKDQMLVDDYESNKKVGYNASEFEGYEDAYKAAKARLKADKYSDKRPSGMVFEGPGSIPNEDIMAFNQAFSKYEGRLDKILGSVYSGKVSDLEPKQKLELAKLRKEMEADVKALESGGQLLEDVNMQQTTEEFYPETKVGSEKPVRAQLDITANRAVEQQVTPDERMALAKDALAKSDYVQKRFGGKIPAAALQALQSKILTPPQMITDPATGARLYQSSPGKWEQLKIDKPEAGTLVNQPLFSPGHESIQNGRQKQYNISGNFKGGSDEKKVAFVAQTQKRARALTSIDRLLQINEGTAEGLRPSLIGEAETIVNEIISSNRVDLIGPGQVAVAEWQMLEKLVRNPAKLVELDSVTKANLMRLRQRMQDVMYDEAYANGLSLTQATSGAEVGRTLRMENLVNRPTS